MLEERFLQRFREIEAETARKLSSLELSAKHQRESLAPSFAKRKTCEPMPTRRSSGLSASIMTQ
jgi:hypothetical protein